jgi:glycosyltransferase involved in cell wall biosynthesis
MQFISYLFYIFIFILIYFISSYSINNFNNTYDEIDKYENLPNIKFAIVIPTFNRLSGQTIPYLKRSINSIINQTHKYWDIILVGDKFEPEELLLNFISEHIIKIPPQNKIIYINNQNVERDHIKNKEALWKCAGATSVNLGLQYCRKNNYKYYCHLDDDDFWSPNHLIYLAKIYNKYPNCIFAHTKSTYLSSYLPLNNIDIYENNSYPMPEQVIHSSLSFRLDIIPYNYFTSFNENDISYPSDYILLYNIYLFLKKNKQYSSIYISKLTCYHDVEGELRK